MQQVFNLMRANDLVWGFVVNNYLMGREPMAFDLLYWNADSVPYMMHSFYLGTCTRRTCWCSPAASPEGHPDRSGGRDPCYFLSAKEDHIAPWASTYRGSLNFKGQVRFVLGARATSPV